MSGHLALVLKNAWRNRRRTMLTVMSIGVSLCLLGVLMAVYKAFYLTEATPEQARRLVVRNRVSLALSMPASYRDRIAQVPGVQEVMVYQWFNGVYKDSRDPNNFFARFAIEPDKLFRVRGEMALPGDQKAAFLADRRGCIVGRRLADRLGFRPGDRINIAGDIFPVDLELTVRGIYDAPTNNEALYFNNQYLEEGLPPSRRGSAGAFYLLAAGADGVPEVARAVDELFRNATVQTRTESEQAFTLSFLAFLGNVKVFLFSIFTAVTFTVLLVAANTMAMSVRERTREIGVLKTLGFRNWEIRGLILSEAALISAAGGAAGSAMAAVICTVIRNGPATFDQVRNLNIDLPVALASLAVAVAVGLVSSIVPAWNAGRLSVVESIRYTG
jgi:putative ABC transport system permease protein